jgi:hypothetical protein
VHPNINVRNVAGLNIPQHDYISMTYYSGTNNPHVITYKEGGSGGQTVATITLSYTTNPPTANDATIASVARS